MVAASATGLALRRDAAVLHLSGALDRAAVTAAWPSLVPLLDGTGVLDRSAVSRVDSAGLALLAEIACRLSGSGAALRIEGTPDGLAELRAAYRLDADLHDADAAP